MREVKGEMNFEQVSTSCVDISENGKALFIPAVFPCKDYGQHDHDEPVWDIRHTRIAWLEALL